MFKILFSLAIFFLSAVSIAHAVDPLTGVTGMADTDYYKYEVRGQSQISLRLSQSLWEGGATQARIAIEKARHAQSRYLLEDAASSLVFDAVAAHVNVSRQKKLVELAERNVQDYTRIMDTLRSRISSGLTTEGDISLVESRRFRAEATLAQYQSELLAAKANFEMVTGSPVPPRLAPVSLPKLSYAGPERVLEACNRHNPRLLAEMETISEAQGQGKLAKAGFFPQVGIEAGPRWQTQNTPQDTHNHGVDAFLTFQWNLYEGGATQSAMRQAAAQTRQARQNVQNVADNLRADILSTWAQYQAAKDRLDYSRKSMDSARKARDVFYEQYLLGSKGLLDLLDADNEYFLGACEYAIASADHVLGAYRLLALGGDILPAMGISASDIAKSPK